MHIDMIMFIRFKYIVMVKLACRERNIYDFLHQLYMNIDVYINNIIMTI